MSYNSLLSMDIEKRKSCIAYIAFWTINEFLEVDIIDFNTEKLFFQVKFEFRMIQQFLDDIPKLFHHFKAAILNVFPLETPQFPINIKFCQAVKEKLNALNVPSYFLAHDDIAPTYLLIAGNVTINPEETVLLAFLNFDNKINIMELKYENDGYEVACSRSVIIDEKENAEIIRQNIIGSCNPKKILVQIIPTNPLKKQLREKYLKMKKAVFFEGHSDDYILKTAVELSKWLLDKSYTKFYVKQLCNRKFMIVRKNGQKMDSIITTEIDEELPLSKSVIIDDPNMEYYLVDIHHTTKRIELLRFIELDKKHQKHQITLSVDIENFPHYEAKPLVQCLPQTLDSMLLSKPPVIGFWDNFSVICIYKDGGYAFLDSWNGSTGKELLISFDEEKPKFFGAAIEVYKTKPSFVVYDILKIMSMPSDYIKIDKKWKFTFTSDDENPVLLKFDSLNGEKKAASPAFLMALFLKQHLKAIKTEIGEKSKQVAFYFFDIFDDSEAKIRIENGLKEACNLLKMDDCSFINL